MCKCVKSGYYYILEALYKHLFLQFCCLEQALVLLTFLFSPLPSEVQFSVGWQQVYRMMSNIKPHQQLEATAYSRCQTEIISVNLHHQLNSTELMSCVKAAHG